ncbi:hypothetical protein SporoP37_12550 [Sporosarcina sp. P37]|uniref:VWA domain-containing protein n=1 Tax=unclassified Sporosarcina TaxID=2647733 RepID=UPI000A17E84C|nr:MULTISPECIES: VWA domain-containing protein [unclassified Sporosarcina]ARK25404.1 hypothetical protein SporoP37_12550 [Sporosarcina sp. P37]PID19043.1 hypothetical protein CSV62_05420 [Sporosarcina sp. P35]
MKIHRKIIALLALLLVSLLVRQPEGTEAAANQSNNSCGIERGRDVVFVIQDTPGMQAQDPSQSRINEAIFAVDQADTLDRFGIVGFNEAVTHSFSLSSNKYQAKAALKKLLTSSEENANDASTGLEKAIRDLSATQSVNDKVIVLMTAGTSINNEKIFSLANEAYEKDIQIHTISFGSTPSSIIDETTLRKISRITDGNFHTAVNAAYLREVLSNLRQEIADFPGRELYSDWTLTSDVTEPRGLLVHENVKVDLNGYNLTVTDDLVLLKCTEIRAVNGAVIKAKKLDQKTGSSIRLNNSQLNVTENVTQDGSIVVNGNYKNSAAPELVLASYTQRIHGYLNLNGQEAIISSPILQEGRIDLNGGTFHAKNNLEQKGRFNVQEGKLQVDGNLTINGGPLLDDAYMENKSLDAGGGLVQVGSKESMEMTNNKGHVRQAGGQLFVNHGTVKIYGDYTISDGWLTMIKGSMDTSTPQYGEGDGDFVHVFGDFSTASKRNHATRTYIHLGKPMNDQGHLTDGVLKIEGTFTQSGDGEGHPIYSDRMLQYEKDYSRYNFHAEGRHKVALMNKGKIRAQAKGFTFNLLELHGNLSDYPTDPYVRWNKLNEVVKSANSNLASLSINDKAVPGFTPAVRNYFRFEVPADDYPAGGAQTLKVDARPQDRNAIVDILDRTLSSDGTGEVKVQVTAVDGTKSVYTVEVKIGPGSGGKVTSIKLDRNEIVFTENDRGTYNPEKIVIGYTVYPTNATNQQVSWTSTNPAVATVTPGGIVTPHMKGETSIVATTADGGLIDTAAVKVLGQNDLLQGIKTLEDFVSDNDRFDKIMGGLYDVDKIGIVVPGNYIKKLTFTNPGMLSGGTIETDSGTARVEVRINGITLGANKAGNNFIFNRASMKVTDYVEVIAYDAVSNELERIGTTYPVNFTSTSGVSPGYYSIKTLLENQVLFNQILEEYSPKQLRFSAR